MDSWDVFHSDRLEVERGLSTAEVHAALARGDLRDDDLVRPAGSGAPWTRLTDMPALFAPAPPPPAPAPPPPPRSEPPPRPAPPPPIAPVPRLDQAQEFDVIDDLTDLRAAYEAEAEEAAEDRARARDLEPPPTFPDDDEDEDEEAIADALVAEDEEELADDLSELDLHGDLEGEPGSRSRVALPVFVGRWDEDGEEFDPQDEDEAAAEFTLSRGSSEKVEELDLAAMVDVAFQLVLFFLVTATTVLYKSLEVPKPNPESLANAAAQQGKSRNLNDLKDTYIVVEVDAAGAMKIDREPVAADLAALIERLRSAREKTGRKAMLLSADFATMHRSAVLAYDAANEIGMGIAIARPTPPAGAPAPAPAAPRKPS